MNNSNNFNEKLRKRIEKSLHDNKDKKQINECKQFWFGYLTALSENKILDEKVYKELRDFVCFFDDKPIKKIEKRKKS